MMTTKNCSTNIEPVQIKAAELSDTNDIALCHIASFPRQFMTQMGPRWLKALYRYFIEHNAVSLVAVDVSGKILGFAVGGNPYIRDEFLRKAIIRYPHIILWKFLTSCLVRKRLLSELLRKLRAKRRTNNTTTSVPNTNMANCGSLMSIAVYPKYQGTGVAGQLIESFQEASKEKGYDALELYVFNNNHRAIEFYKKHNWYEVSKQKTQTQFRRNLTSN